MDRFKNAVGPAELAIMQTVLDRYCAARGIEAVSIEHQDLATRLFAYFERGATTSEALIARLEAHGPTRVDKAIELPPVQSGGDDDQANVDLNL